MKNVIKAVIVVSAFVGMTNMAMAQTTKTVNCEMIEKIATKVMDNRQSGVPLADMMKVVNNPNAGAFGGVAKALTMLAYEQPRFNTKANQQKAIVDFANEAMLVCLKAKK
jgi:hypothetical protein